MIEKKRPKGAFPTAIQRIAITEHFNVLERRRKAMRLKTHLSRKDNLIGWYSHINRYLNTCCILMFKS